MDHADNALKRNGAILGGREVDIKSISRQRVDSILNSFKNNDQMQDERRRPNFNDRDGDQDRGTDLFLSNVPYRAGVDDILEEFHAFDLRPHQVDFMQRNGQPTGTVRVSFNSHEDAVEALERKNMCKLMNRTIYIKFFRHSNYNNK